MLNFIRAILCFLRFDKMYFKSGLKAARLGDAERALGAFAYEEDIAPTVFAGDRPGSINYQRAIANYTKAIDLNPKFTNAYYNRGGAYYDLGDYRRAIEDYTKAIDLNPEFADAYYSRGSAYYDLGDYRQAIKDYNKVIKWNPQDAEAYYHRGLAYNSLGNHQKAIIDLKKVIELAPTNSPTSKAATEKLFELSDIDDVG